jgi:subtilase family serine protease
MLQALTLGTKSKQDMARFGASGLGAWLFAALAAPASAATPALVKLVPAVVSQHQARLLGPADPTTNLTLSIALPMRNLDGLRSLVRDIYDPLSPQYRHYITVPQFADRFGPAKADYDAAVRFFAGAGLRVTSTSANHYILDVSGTVGAIEQVFHVQLNMYQHPTEARSFMSPDREPTLDLAKPVLQIVGLDDDEKPYTRLLSPDMNHGRKAMGTGGSGPDGWYIGSDMRAAYYGQKALTGLGQTVGLMELAPYYAPDIPLYFNTVKQSLSVDVFPIATDGTPALCSTPCGDGEQTLDIDYAISVAPGLYQVQVYVAKNPESVLNRMAADNMSQQLSTSWGWPRRFKMDDPLFLEMAAQGQTFLTASGDYSSLQASGPWPEEDANLTGVGGTDLTTSKPGGAWVGETAWEYSAGGPSLFKKIKIPSYQVPFINAANAGSTVVRNVPDVAAAADFNFYICGKGKCSGGWGGTSFASPIWAGFIALANEDAANHHLPPVGFLNPALYRMSGNPATYADIFHDITSGTSGVYSAVPGFDLVTGFGSPNSLGLIDALGQ